MRKPKTQIKTVFKFLFEGYRPFEVDTTQYCSLVMATDANEAVSDVLFYEGIGDAPEDWNVSEMEVSELNNRYLAWRTPLATLREFPGWQDAGQTDGSLESDQPMLVFPDGSVQFDEENGYIDLCPAPREYYGNDWIQWLSIHYGS